MVEQGRFYVRFPTDPNTAGSIATGIQVIIPEGMTYEQARALVLSRIVDELSRYAVQECLSNFGIRPR